MSVVNNLKPLLSSSSLFHAQDQQQRPDDGHQRKHRARSKSKKELKHMLKVGTGGTLDPLADGVLGEWFFEFGSFFFHENVLPEAFFFFSFFHLIQSWALGRVRSS